MMKLPYLAPLAALAVSLPMFSHAFKLSGEIDTQVRYFADDPVYSQQSDIYSSLAIKPELYWEWSDGDDSFTFTPFHRVDAKDNERTHSDIRELLWIHVGEVWETRVGVSRVFWGVTESQHLVDVINQTDAIEAPDGEEKLGQPMIGLSTNRDEWGIFQAFLLPGFRERTFPGVDGRLRMGENIVPDIEPVDRLSFVVTVDPATAKAYYESGAGRNHTDVALRWSKNWGTIDTALSYFRGTSRDPEFVDAQRFRIDYASLGGVLDLSLHPYYRLMEQAGMELQWLLGGWTWKMEAIHRDFSEGSRAAATGGFEYTFFSVFESDADVGLLLEKHYDNRDASISAFQNDTFVGTRLSLNDVQSTMFLGGAIVDNENGSQSWFVEFSRRLTDEMTLSIESQVFRTVDEDDALLPVAQDSFVQAEVQFYF